MLKNKKVVLLIAALLTVAFLVVGCSGQTPSAPNNTAEKGKVKILYVEWACATATSHVLADVLERKMGYEVELVPLAASAMYQGLATGDGDALFCCWLPVTHGDYMKSVGDQVENLGTNMEGAKIGLVVPKYVTINSIEEMNGVKDKFGGKIIGIDPGAGIMKCTEAAIKDYNLDYTLVEGSDATMVAALKKAYDNQEWIAVTGWTPHWKFASWDLKYLDDPKKSYGEAEHVDTVVRKGLKTDMPEVYELFDNFKWTSDDLSKAMIIAEEEGQTSKTGAAKWVDQNQELVNSWLPEKYRS